MSREDPTEMNRRQLLKYLSGLGLSGASLRHVTPSAVANTDEDEVPILHAIRLKNPEKASEKRANGEQPERERVYRNIPYEQFVRIKSRQKAEAKVGDHVDAIDGTNGYVTVSTGHRINGGHRELIIEVTRNVVKSRGSDGTTTTREPDVSLDEIRDRVPDTVDAEVGEGDRRREVQDIPIVVNELEEYDDHECDGLDDWNYNYDYDPVPGGCLGRITENDNDESWCTIGTPATHDNRGQVIFSAGHCTIDAGDGEDYSDGVGSDLDQRYDDETYLGSAYEVKYYKNTNDYDFATDAAAFDCGTWDTTDYLANDSGGYDEVILGFYSMDTLRVMEDNDEYIYKQGRRTGRCIGKIRNVSDSSKMLRINAPRGGGDSGGPHFDLESGDAYIAGLHRGGGTDDDGTEFATAYAAEYVSQDFNVHIP